MSFKEPKGLEKGRAEEGVGGCRQDYEQYEKAGRVRVGPGGWQERDFEPKAPFHHNAAWSKA